MAQSTAPRLRFQIFRLRRLADTGPDLGLETILPRAWSSRSSTRRGRIGVRLYTPWLTFWAFFWQALGPDHSCLAAVKRVAAGMARRGEELDDEDTGAYCKARARLPESVPSRLIARWATGSMTRRPRDGCGAAAGSRWSTARR